MICSWQLHGYMRISGNVHTKTKTIFPWHQVANSFSGGQATSSEQQRPKERSTFCGKFVQNSAGESWLGFIVNHETLLYSLCVIETTIKDKVHQGRSPEKVAVLLDFVQMRGGEGPAQIFCPLFTNCIYWVNLGMGREGETPAQIFWHIGVQKKWYKLSKLGGGGGRGNLDKIQQNSYLFSGNLPL